VLHQLVAQHRGGLSKTVAGNELRKERRGSGDGEVCAKLHKIDPGKYFGHQPSTTSNNKKKRNRKQQKTILTFRPVSAKNLSM